jgi:hypothetical protein
LNENVTVDRGYLQVNSFQSLWDRQQLATPWAGAARPAIGEDRLA